jgi:hypothetical protein
MLDSALQEINAARDDKLLRGRGTAEEKFAEFIIGAQGPGVEALSRI